ncbi:MAG: CAP domain-containing protein, partial [Pyrinomonadaceae bacterium]
MHRKPFLFLGLFAVMAMTAFAQVNNFQAPQAVKIMSGNASYDPLGILEDDDETDSVKSGVKALVVVNMASAEKAAFELINRKRVESGLSLLVWSDEVAETASIHSRNMAEFQFFSHRGLDDKLVSDRADAQGMRKWRAIGENIAFNRGYSDPVTKAVDLWLS